MPRVGGREFAYTKRGRKKARLEARKLQRAKVGEGGKPMPGGRPIQKAGEVVRGGRRMRGGGGARVMKGGEPSLKERFGASRRRLQGSSRQQLKQRMKGEGTGADVARKMLMRQSLQKQLGPGFVKKFQKGIEGKRHFQQIQRLKGKDDLSEKQQERLEGLRESRKELVSRRKGYRPGMTFNVKTGKWERKKKQPRAQIAD